MSEKYLGEIGGIPVRSKEVPHYSSGEVDVPANKKVRLSMPQEEFDLPKLYTSNPKLAEQWRKDYPGIEVVITPKQIPTNTRKVLGDEQK